MIDALGWPLLIGLIIVGLLVVLVALVAYAVLRRPRQPLRAEDVDPDAFRDEG